MKSTLLAIVSFAFLFLQHSTVFGQEPADAQNDSTTKEKNNNFNISVTAGSSMLQKGKKAAESAYFYNPIFSYSHSSGFSASAGANLIPSDKKTPVDNISLSAGYSKTFFEHWSIGASYGFGHYYSSKQVASTEANTISLSTSWSNNIITPSLGAAYAFGQANDLTYSATLSHDFSFDGLITDDDNLSFPISISATAGTTNFYSEYVKKNPNKIVSKKKKTAVTAADINTDFALTALTFGAGVAYTIKSFTISSDMSYLLMTNDSSDLDLSNSPIFTFTLSYSF
jgi:hypothetical protein